VGDDLRPRVAVEDASEGEGQDDALPDASRADHQPERNGAEQGPSLGQRQPEEPSIERPSVARTGLDGQSQGPSMSVVRCSSGLLQSRLSLLGLAAVDGLK
jgi:hypothetical protein